MKPQTLFHINRTPLAAAFVLITLTKASAVPVYWAALPPAPCTCSRDLTVSGGSAREKKGGGSESCTCWRRTGRNVGGGLTGEETGGQGRRAAGDQAVPQRLMLVRHLSNQIFCV